MADTTKHGQRVMADLSALPQDVQDDLNNVQAKYLAYQQAVAAEQAATSAVSTAQADLATKTATRQQAGQDLHDSLNTLTTDLVKEFPDPTKTPAAPVNRTR